MVVSTGGHWTTGLFRGYHKGTGGRGMKSWLVLGNETELSSSSSSGGSEGEGGEGLPRFDEHGRVIMNGGGEGDGGREVEKGSVVFGYDGLLTFFGEVMHTWAQKVQDALTDDLGVVQVSPPSSKRRYPFNRAAKNNEDELGRATTTTAEEGRRAERQVILRPYLPGHFNCHTFREPFGEIVPVEREHWNWGEIWKYNRIFEVCLSFLLIPSFLFPLLSPRPLPHHLLL
ncbi:hypothetical protein NMY22_g9863 [Coprinellus aureogranulatus]|nr:hypothetical protein NMY22_g9863 [Coprinellus aureogranulatus]